MSHHIYDEYYIEIPPENMINPFSIISNYENNKTHLSHPINNLENTRHSQYNSNQINNSNATPTSLIITNNNPWRPNETFMCIYNKFQLFQLT
jgi:hypothetical protein